MVGNIVPADMRAMVLAYREGKTVEALQWHRKIFGLARDLLGIATNPIPLKTALKILGRDTGDVRLPLCELDAASEQRVRDALAAYGLVG